MPSPCPHVHRDMTGRCTDCGAVVASHRATHLAEQAEHAGRDAADPPIDWRARALAAEAMLADSREREATLQGTVYQIAHRLGAREHGYGGQTLDAGERRLVRGIDVRIDALIAAEAAIESRAAALADECLRAAPEVEAAIEVIFGTATHPRTCHKDDLDTEHSKGYRGSPGEPEDCDCHVSSNLDALRAAIAAAQARAVEAARVGWVEAVSEERAEELIQALEGETARNLDQLEAAVADLAAGNDNAPARPMESTARAALLAALTGGRR